MTLDKAGKLTGLVVSVLFFSFGVWYLSSGKLAFASQKELGLLYAFVIILGGPIPYFFVNVTDTRAKLSTPLGQFSLAGGYVVAVLATVFALKVVPQDEHSCVHISCNNYDHDIAPTKIAVFPTERVYFTRSNVSDSQQQLEGLCYFHPGENSVSITLKYLTPNGIAKKLVRTVTRDQKDCLISLDDAN
jgi:hypothetical protein